jgi:hypothetical protein
MAVKYKPKRNKSYTVQTENKLKILSFKHNCVSYCSLKSPIQMHRFAYFIFKIQSLIYQDLSNVMLFQHNYSSRLKIGQKWHTGKMLIRELK